MNNRKEIIRISDKMIIENEKLSIVKDKLEKIKRPLRNVLKIKIKALDKSIDKNKSCVINVYELLVLAEKTDVITDEFINNLGLDEELGIENIGDVQNYKFMLYDKFKDCKYVKDCEDCKYVYIDGYGEDDIHDWSDDNESVGKISIVPGEYSLGSTLRTDSSKPHYLYGFDFKKVIEGIEEYGKNFYVIFEWKNNTDETIIDRRYKLPGLKYMEWFGNAKPYRDGQHKFQIYPRSEEIHCSGQGKIKRSMKEYRVLGSPTGNV